jgi:hypothetical protein
MPILARILLALLLGLCCSGPALADGWTTPGSATCTSKIVIKTITSIAQNNTGTYETCLAGPTSHSTGSSDKVYLEFNILGMDTSAHQFFGAIDKISYTALLALGVSINPAGQYYVNGTSTTPVSSYFYATALGIQIGALGNYTIGMAVDFSHNEMWLRLTSDSTNPGGWNTSSSANPSTNTGGISISALTSGKALYPYWQADTGNGTYCATSPCSNDQGTLNTSGPSFSGGSFGPGNESDLNGFS